MGQRAASPVVSFAVALLGAAACGGEEFGDGGETGQAGSAGSSTLDARGGTGAGASSAGGASGAAASSGHAGTTGNTDASAAGGAAGSGHAGTAGIGLDAASDVTSRDAGCADGERELFTDVTRFPDVAGCSGGFSVPGVTTDGSRAPRCARAGGDDGVNPVGAGCSVEDLCAEGWQVCASAAEVAARGVTECDTSATGPAIWITRQGSGPGFPSDCVDGGTNNLVGCGPRLVDAGFPGAVPASCAPLDAIWIWRDCEAVGVWSCNSTSAEPTVVTKGGPDHGGVLCCRTDPTR